MNQELPPPFPPGNEDATSFVTAMPPPPPYPDAATQGAGMNPRTQHTSTRFAVPAAIEGDTDMGPAGRQRRKTADARMRKPAPAERRPTLLPNLAAAQPVRGPKTIRPDMDNPIQIKDTGGHGFGENSRESSDVISSFQSPQKEGHPGQPAPHPLQAQQRQRRPTQQGGGRQPGRAAARRPASGRPISVRAVAGRAPTRAAPGRKAPPRQTYNPPPRPQPPAMLPLNQEYLGLLIADQRRRLHVLFGYARGLEIAAGILGTLSLAVLIASLVSILIGSGATVVASASALAGSATGLALTLIMVVGAVSIRQLAHTSAQLAALIEALCQPPGF